MMDVEYHQHFFNAPSISTDFIICLIFKIISQANKGPSKQEEKELKKKKPSLYMTFENSKTAAALHVPAP